MSTQRTRQMPTRLLPPAVGYTAKRSPLVDSTALAGLLGVSRDYVYEHADELGAIRLGSGPKARLRFSVEDAMTCLTSKRSQGQNLNAGGDSQQPAKRRGGRRPLHQPQPGEILPIRPRRARRAA